MAATLALLTMAVAVGARAPDPWPIEPGAAPVEQEPLHRLAFDGGLVRVFDLRLPALSRGLSHQHAQDTVLIAISAGRGEGQAVAAAGDASFAAAGSVQVVTNSGASEQRFIEVEILPFGRPAARVVTGEPDHVLEIENERVRIYRVRLDPGDSIPVHTHSAGWLSVTIDGAPGPGAYRWYDAGDANPLTAGSYKLEAVEVEPR